MRTRLGLVVSFLLLLGACDSATDDGPTRPDAPLRPDATRSVDVERRDPPPKPNGYRRAPSPLAHINAGPPSVRKGIVIGGGTQGFPGTGPRCAPSRWSDLM